MPTNNKTTNLNLNSWLSTDKPKREDFVNDNVILDTIIGTHLNDSVLHFSSDDRAKLNSPFEVGTLSGNGSETKTHTLTFAPSLFIVYLKSYPPSHYNASESYNFCNWGIAVGSGGYSSMGVSMSGNSITLSQGASSISNIFMNLNKYAGQYGYIAFK